MNIDIASAFYCPDACAPEKDMGTGMEAVAGAALCARAGPDDAAAMDGEGD